MIGSAYFVGYSVSCLIIPRIADIYGRRLPYIVSSFIQFLVYFGIFFSRDSLMTIALILIFGFCGAGRSGIGYLYLLEMMPADWKTMVGTLTHSVNSCTFIVSAIYFWYVSKDWRWLILYALVANGITVIAVCFVPESPIYSYAAKDFDKARESLNKIGRFNGCKEEITDKFDVEPAHIQ